MTLSTQCDMFSPPVDSMLLDIYWFRFCRFYSQGIFYKLAAYNDLGYIYSLKHFAYNQRKEAEEMAPWVIVLALHA